MKRALYVIKKEIKNLIKFHPNMVIGKDVYIDATTTIIGKSNIEIGDYSVIGQDSWLNVNTRDENIRLKVGKNCLLGRRFYIGTGEYCEIGDYFLSGEDCKILGANHDFSNPMIPYVIGDVYDSTIIRIGANVWFGAGVTVIGKLNLGYGSVIGAGTIVTSNIPPFSIVVGTPGKIIRQYDFKLKEWVATGGDNNSYDRGIPTEKEYKEVLEKEYPHIGFPLEAITNRFGGI